MVGNPVGLYYLLGVLMLVTAAYGLVLLLTSIFDRRSGGRDVEISHVAMGVSMAGMFVPAWASGPSVLWEVIFVALLAWFVVRSIQSVQVWGLHVPHTAIHAVMSFAMLLMYWFPAGRLAPRLHVHVDGHEHGDRSGPARPGAGLRDGLASLRLGDLHHRISKPRCHLFRYALQGDRAARSRDRHRTRSWEGYW